MPETPLTPWPMTHGDPKKAGWVLLFFKDKNERLSIWDEKGGWLDKDEYFISSLPIGWRPLWDPQPPETMPDGNELILLEWKNGGFSTCAAGVVIKQNVKSWHRLYPSPPVAQPDLPDDDLPDVDMYIHKVPESQLLAELVRREKERDRQWAATAPPKKEDLG